jgi:geranylgeranyl transferase type-2 subunit alpha
LVSSVSVINFSIWCLRLLAELEVKMGKDLSTSVLLLEIGLCNAFFEKDCRNFHAWNYRLSIFKMIYEFFPSNFWEFVAKELPFTISMISKSFSNFSAWHYRSKLIPLHFEHNDIDWNSKPAFEYFKKDLEFITNAIYTDPKDQSPWNYHYWIISNLIPFYVYIGLYRLIE